MAKKKIKTKASLLAATAAASVNESRKNDNVRDHYHEKDDINGDFLVPNQVGTDKVEILTVQLKAAVGKSSSLHKQSRVILTSSDALQLDVSVGDDVIILSFDDDFETKYNHKRENDDINLSKRVIKALAVLPIEIYNEKQTSEAGSSNHRTSPMVLRKNASQQQWSPGTIQITSLSLLEKFTSSLSATAASSSSIDQRMSEMSLAEKHVTSSILSTPSVLTPVSQPSTTPFSFKNMVSTPTSNVYRTPGSSSTTKSKIKTDHHRKEQQNNVKVIPCRTQLGQFILQSCTSLCTNMTVVQVDSSLSSENHINDNTTPIDASSMNHFTKSSLRTLERLIHAHLLDSYVVMGQQFRISFTGKPVHFQILNATNIKENQNDPDLDVGPPIADCINEPLDDIFSRLNLQSNEDTNDSSVEVKQLYSSISNSSIQLYHILRSTKISISNPKAHNESIAVGTDNTVAANLPNATQYVAGLSTTLDELRSMLLTPLRRPELFTNRGMKVPRGVLLHGPNGVGKTCLAKQFLSELENQFHCRTQYVHCASLQSKSDIVGEAESVLSKLFRPTSSVPTLLVLDDIHLICSKRGSGGSSQGMDRLAATLLALMDGIEGNGHLTKSSSSKSSSPGNVIIVAITTNPSVLDPALRRPGRLDAEIEVPLPEDTSSRAEIIQFHVTKFGIELAQDLKQQGDFLDVAKAAKGFNGADCMLAVKEAIRIAILESTESGVVLQKQHLLAAMRSIKPSAIKSITVEIPQVLWSSIGGMDSVKRDLREAIELPLSHNAYFEQLRVPPPRGILLYGPPGCSKTLMARALATEGNMNFLAVKGPELLSKWLGESERALSSLFRRARMASPAIVFFDEIDAIASKRGSGDSASSGRLLSQLLTELDGVNHTGTVGGGKTKHHRVVVVGATNRPDLLDTALTRPGRIDRMIYVGPPDAASRAQILRITLQKSCCSTDIDISILADDSMTGGFSGAEMVAICRDAALLALEEDEGSNENIVLRQPSSPMIEMRHLLRAIQSMPRQITPSMIEFYKAYQEKVTAI